MIYEFSLQSSVPVNPWIRSQTLLPTSHHHTVSGKHKLISSATLRHVLVSCVMQLLNMLYSDVTRSPLASGVLQKETKSLDHSVPCRHHRALAFPTRICKTDSLALSSNQLTAALPGDILHLSLLFHPWRRTAYFSRHRKPSPHHFHSSPAFLPRDDSPLGLCDYSLVDQYAVCSQRTICHCCRSLGDERLSSNKSLDIPMIHPSGTP